MSDVHDDLIVCGRAPFGWWCSRTDIKHTIHGEGPCAARPRWFNFANAAWWRPARHYRRNGR